MAVAVDIGNSNGADGDHWFGAKDVLADVLEHLSRTLIKEYATELGLAGSFVVTTVGEQDIDHSITVDISELNRIGILSCLANSSLGGVFP